MTDGPGGCRYSAERLSQGCLDSTSDSIPRSMEMPGDSHPVSGPWRAAGM